MEIIAESNLSHSGTINIWTPSRIKKYLRKYSLGKGKMNAWGGMAKNRYYKSDVDKAYKELVETEPRDANGIFLNPSLSFLQSENCIQ